MSRFSYNKPNTYSAEHTGSYGRASMGLSRDSRLSQNDTKFNDQSDEEEKFLFKFTIIIIGNSSVGKTSIFNRFMDNTFSNDYKVTISVVQKVKRLSVDQETAANLEIWDTMGTEKYKSIALQYFRRAQGVVLVYDISNRESFNDLQNWIKDVEGNSEPGIPIFLAGNKSDLGEYRQVSLAEAKNFAKEKGFDCLEVSAKTGSNVSLLFEKLAVACVKREKEKEKQKLSHERRSNSEKTKDTGSEKEAVRLGDVQKDSNEDEVKSESKCC